MRKLVVLLLLPVCFLHARNFYPDDPIEREPPPIPVDKPKQRKISDVYDLFRHVFATPGEKQPPLNPIPAKAVNTLGEVPDNAWYRMRHARRRMTIDELRRGPGNSNPPAAKGVWTVISAKGEGITPGFLIEDAKGSRYFVKFDPLTNPEMATAADVISSKFFHAFGYNVPENYIVDVDPKRLEIRPKASFVDQRGIQRSLLARDIDAILARVPRDSDGRIRAAASALIKGDIIREFRWYGTRADDPNDIVPHEHRRDLRGLHVFCAWLGHEDSRAINTLDTVVEENGVRFVKHYLIDFGSTLGSASTKANSPRSGWEQFFTWKSAAREFFTFGIWTPGWARIRYPDLPSVGRFTAERFDPAEWTPEYPNPAFRNRLPDDSFWAARQVMTFKDDEIRAIVNTGRYSDPAAEKYVGDVLIARRNAIGRTYLSRPGTLDRIRVEKDRVAFDDLSVAYGYREPPVYSYEWFRFDNENERMTPMKSPSSSRFPVALQSGEYAGVKVSAGPGSPVTTIYFRGESARIKVVGIERAWN